MVRLLNSKNVHILAKVLYLFLSLQASMAKFADIGQNNIRPCIYAIWHSDQLCLHDIPDKKDLNILISNSIDGEIITQVIQRMGFSVVRGSSGKKGCISSTLQMISLLKSGKSVAVTVDGPQGPFHKVKGGIVKLAKETGVPVIPLCWYADRNFFHLPSWDKMVIPLGFVKIINLFGDPIYINKDEDSSTAAKRIEDALNNLDKIAPDEYKKAKKNKLWDKK